MDIREFATSILAGLQDRPGDSDARIQVGAIRDLCEACVQMFDLLSAHEEARKAGVVEAAKASGLEVHELRPGETLDLDADEPTLVIVRYPGLLGSPIPPFDKPVSPEV
jgi:hypothetical protein